VWFEGDLDHRNWVFDFGGMKRAKTKIHNMQPTEFFAWLLDHTTIVAQDDPYMDKFVQMDKDGIFNFAYCHQLDVRGLLSICMV